MSIFLKITEIVKKEKKNETKNILPQHQFTNQTYRVFCIAPDVSFRSVLLLWRRKKQMKGWGWQRGPINSFRIQRAQCMCEKNRHF